MSKDNLIVPISISIIAYIVKLALYKGEINMCISLLHVSLNNLLHILCNNSTLKKKLIL